MRGDTGVFNTFIMMKYADFFTVSIFLMSIHSFSIMCVSFVNIS